MREKPLLGIVDNRQVWASGNIYEKDLERVQVGQGAIVRVAGLENRLFRGRVDRIDPVVRDGQRVIPVRVELDNLSGELKPGMFAELEIAHRSHVSPGFSNSHPRSGECQRSRTRLRR